MARAVGDFRERFDEIVTAHDDWNEALTAVLVDGFSVTDKDVLKLRVLVVEHGRVSVAPNPCLARRPRGPTSVRSNATSSSPTGRSSRVGCSRA